MEINQEYNLIDVNEMSTKPSAFSIAAVEHNKASKKLNTTRSTRQRWYQNYSVGEEFQSRMNSGKNISQPRKQTQELSAIQAMAQTWLETDIRPKIFDNITKSWTLCDSGSVEPSPLLGLRKLQ